MRNNIVQNANIYERAEQVCTKIVQAVLSSGFMPGPYDKPYRTFVKGNQLVKVSLSEGIVIYQADTTKKKHRKFSGKELLHEAPEFFKQQKL